MKIAVFGLGIIGSIWTQHLQADRHDVQPWNRTPKNFPGFVPDPIRAADGAEFLYIVVADVPAVQAVLDLILRTLKPGQIVLQASTISPSASIDFARQVEATGASYLETPFTGSKTGALARKTVFYVGGDADVLERARPAMAPLSQNILHIGPLGKAAALKLAFNLNLAGILQSLSESLTLARSYGIEDATYWDALRVNPGWSGMAALKEPALSARDWSPQFSVKHMSKDVRLALEAAAAAPQPALLPQTQLLSEKIYAEGIRRGWAEDDLSSLIRLLDES